MRRSEDIRAQAEASAISGKSRRRGRSQEDDHSLTFNPNEFGVREPNSAEIRPAVFEKRSYGRTRRQTDRQTECCRFMFQIYVLDRQTDRQTDTSVLYIDYSTLQSARLVGNKR